MKEKDQRHQLCPCFWQAKRRILLDSELLFACCQENKRTIRPGALDPHRDIDVRDVLREILQTSSPKLDANECVLLAAKWIPFS